MGWFLYDRDLYHERVNFIHEDIILLDTHHKLRSEASIEKGYVNSEPFQI